MGERMMRSWTLIFVYFWGLNFASAWDGKSAQREPGVSFRNYIQRMLEDPAPLDVQDLSAYASAQPFKNGNLPAATALPSEAEMQAQFEHIRDERWMTTANRPNFLRRSSWLFPDDGCFARAALAIMNMHRWSRPVPSKVFVFGDLVVKTKNSPDGEVAWWYHVAPLVEVAGQKYVLDPAIEPAHPLKLDEWLKTMHADYGNLQVAVCRSGTYSPGDSCNRDTDGVEIGAQRDQIDYLHYEWSRLEELNRDPNAELGDKPPWAGTKPIAIY